MKVIKNDIKNKTFKRVYLLYGEEVYLKKLYKQRLSDAALGGADEMNRSVFNDKIDDTGNLREMCDTMPFFAEKRVIVCENSGLFSSSNDFSDYVNDIPDTTVLIFIEDDVDKRTKLFKAVSDIGYICELKKMTDDELKAFCVSLLGKTGKRISEAACDYLFENIGTDTYNLINETEKLIAYTGDRNVITREDIDAVCTLQIQNHIFDMLDAIGEKDVKRTLRLYFDLIALRQTPFSILYLINRNYLKLLSIYDMLSDHMSDDEIAAKLRIPAWTIRKKYRAQLKNYSRAKLIRCLEECADLEYRAKSGIIDDQLGLEIMLANLTSV